MPISLELVPDGYHLFRFDILQVDGGFTAHEVRIDGAIDAKKIKAIAISEKWGDGVEAKLINDYNEYKLGIGDVAAEVAYMQFLADRKALKNYVDEVVGE